MAQIGVLLNIMFKRVRATEQLHCLCCNADGKKTDRGIIAKGEVFFCVNAFSSYIKRCNKAAVIPYGLQTQKTRGMNPADFRHPIEARKLCIDCFEKLLRLYDISVDSEIRMNVEYRIETRPLYHTNTAVSMYEYSCNCCGEEIPLRSSYSRFGIYRSDCVCNECRVILSPFT